jgi:hypothetical protein
MIMLSGAVSVISAIALLMAGGSDERPRSTSSRPSAVVETGVHWAPIRDFPTLRQLGYSFVVAIAGNTEREWDELFQAAAASELKLVVGLYPPPFTWNNERWSITQRGRRFLEYVAARSARVKGVFVFNEPYWMDPLTYRTDICGAVSAARLRSLRNEIRAVWPAARIFHDIGHPSAWAPGGSHHSQYRCVANKYADATGVADFVGVWYYPFNEQGYERDEALSLLAGEVRYVREKMGAEPVILGQAFKCLECGGEANRWPQQLELRNWNCSARTLQPAAISWYVWRSNQYDRELASEPSYWQETTAEACAPQRLRR